MKRLAIVTSHPIQYNAPLFSLLTQRAKLEVKVFYTWGESVLTNKFDPGFNKVVAWNIPLLEGYSFEFLENTSADKGSHHFKGIVNPGLNKSVLKFQPDAILVYGWSFSSHFKLLRFFKNKVPLIFRGDSTLIDEKPGMKKWFRRLFLRYVYRHVDIALYAGQANRNYFISAGLKPGQLVFGPHAVDNERFTCNTAECKDAAASIRLRLGIDENSFVFLFAGKLEAKKDPLLLLRAFTSNQFPATAHLVFGGNGELENQLKSEAIGKPNIHFMGFTNQGEMPALYESANVFVLPSRGPGETWGLAVNEAMANGKPVIVSDKCGCAKDLVANGLNGFVFSSGDIDELAGAMKALHGNREKAREFGEYSRERIADYSLQKLAAAIEDTVFQFPAR